VSGQSITAEPPPAVAPPVEEPGAVRRYAVAALFLLPAVVFLGVWIVYPTVYTIVRSFFGREGFSSFVGIDNYRTLFTSDILLTAIKNNAVWVLVVPAFVTAIGLVFAVMIERVRWSIAFRTAVFMPMAISLFAAGVIWRIMDQQDPNLGAVNAAIGAVKDTVSPPGVLSTAAPSTPALAGDPQKGGLSLKQPLQAGGVALVGLTAINITDIPKNAHQARKPAPAQGAIAGVVWRDFKPGGGKPGVVEPGEDGLPGVTVELRNQGGAKVASATTADDGTFTFPNVGSGSFRVAIGSSTFAEPFGGVGWLGPRLITPAVIIAYVWVWAGFAMVVIAAGLAAIPRDVLEAARTDGGSEWQVFRRVTAPLLAPVLSVVFITMIINVLKVFDIVLSVAPGSVQDDANVIALAMWRTSFGGVNDFGVGSAIAVFLFVLVVPVLLLNIRRFRTEG
jgi:alpha-glucoside transport system permease protein